MDERPAETWRASWPSDRCLEPGQYVHGPAVKRVETAAKALGIDIEHVKIRDPAELGDALLAISRRQGGLLVLEDATINVCSAQIASTAVKYRRAAIFGLTTFAEAGGLMAWLARR
jgi:hypothetical protein